MVEEDVPLFSSSSIGAILGVRVQQWRKCRRPPSSAKLRFDSAFTLIPCAVGIDEQKDVASRSRQRHYLGSQAESTKETTEFVLKVALEYDKTADNRHTQVTQLGCCLTEWHSSVIRIIEIEDSLRPISTPLGKYLHP